MLQYISLCYRHAGSMSHESVIEKAHLQAHSGAWPSPALAWIPLECRDYRPDSPYIYRSLFTSWNLRGNVAAFLFWLFSSKTQCFRFNVHEAISFPKGAWHHQPTPIVPPLNSSVINARPTPNTKLTWLQTKPGEEKSQVNSLDPHNFHLLNILSQMNHFIGCTHFLPSLIS